LIFSIFSFATGRAAPGSSASEEQAPGGPAAKVSFLKNEKIFDFDPAFSA